MFKFLRKHQTFLFSFVAICIVGVMFFGIGTNAIMHSPFDAVLRVNGTKINQAQFDQVYNQLVHQQKEFKPEMRQQIMSQTMNELIREEVFNQEAKHYGIVVPDQEVMLTIQGTPAFQKEGKFDIGTYAQTLNQVLGITPNEFEKLKKKELAARKVNQVISSSIQISDQLVQQELAQRISAEKDPKKRKELMENPGNIRVDLRNREINFVLNDWLNQINSRLKVEILSDSFKKQLNGGQPT